MILSGFFFICCFIFFVMGIFMGIIIVFLFIGVGLVISLGLFIELVFGIVVGGVMFGDNLFFVLDIIIVVIWI